MPFRGRYRALSIDLWFTSFYHGPEDPARWEAARVRVLERYLRRPDGTPFAPELLAEAARGTYARMNEQPHAAIRTDPAQVVQAVATALGATIVGPAGAAATAYSAAGLESDPPTPNPEAMELLAWCADRGIPCVLVTNSARRAATWEEHLRARGGPVFQQIVSSCDLGCGKPDPRIFLEAARRLGRPAAEILHVGDRWELDVVGAKAAGFGAALYRGLWGRYPAGLYDGAPAIPEDRSDVPVLESLTVLADEARWALRAARLPTG